LLKRGILGIGNFKVNVENYVCGKTSNLFFNRIVYIDNEGNIKNWIYDSKKFGNINKDSFEKVINSDQFQLLWNIRKDDISICKECQYRYVCPDNRIPLVNDKNEYYHSSECNYNPIKDKWKVQ